MMRAAAIPRMSADDFLPWAARQAEGRRYELVDGEVVATAPERAQHTRAKYRAARALDDAIRAAGLPCESFVDGLSVRVRDQTVYAPDALVRCGERLDPDAVAIADPIVVVEVTSPSSSSIDAGTRLDDYFPLPSVRHDLIVKTRTRTVIHHARDAEGAIRTHIRTEGPIALDPPGIVLAFEDLLAA